MIKIEVQTVADSQMRAAVRRLGKTETVNRQVSAQLYGWVIRNFDAAGRMQFPPWKPLAASTLAQKARLGFSLQPLMRTGNLRQSFIGFYDDKVGGVGARASFILQGRRFDYAVAHQEGTERIPARPMLPPEDYVRRVARAAFENFVARSIQPQGAA